jgi:hypothetical protein
VCRQRQQRRTVAVLDEVVLRDPDSIEAELLGEHDLLDRLRVEPLVRHAPRGRVAEVVQQTELHGASGGSSVAVIGQREYCTCPRSRGGAVVQRKLTITVSDDVYRGLHQRVGRGAIRRFIEDLVRPHVVDDELEALYREAAQDEAAERKAMEWIEADLGEGTP